MLPKETNELWNLILETNSFSGFILIGGSALSLRIAHRLSEDLDIVAVDSPRLPLGAVSQWVRCVQGRGWQIEKKRPPASLADEAQMLGEDPDDYVQNYLVNGKVKVTVFSPDLDLRRCLEPAGSDSGIRVATLGEVFRMKALVTSARVKTRDWVDLYALFQLGYTAQDYLNAYKRSDAIVRMELGLNNMCEGVPRPDDEGYLSLMSHPPSVETMQAYFRTKREEVRSLLIAPVLAPAIEQGPSQVPPDMVPGPSFPLVCHAATLPLDSPTSTAVAAPLCWRKDTLVDQHVPYQDVGPAFMAARRDDTLDRQ